MRPCCVPKCGNKNAPRHTFPRNDNIRAIWLQRINNSKLKNDYAFLKSYRVCEVHFDQICKETEGRLKRFSLPTLFIPGYTCTSSADCFFSFSQAKNVSLTPERIKKTLAEMATQSTLEDTDPLKVTKPMLAYGIRKLATTNKEAMDSSDATQLHTLQPLLVSAVAPSTSSSIIEPKYVMEEPHFAVPKDTYSISISSEVPRLKRKVLQLTSRELSSSKLLEHELKFLYRAAKKSKSNKIPYRQKVKILQKHDKLLKFLSNANPKILQFLSQVHNKTIKPRGRRYSMSEKIFALSIFKQSGKAYKFLSSVFSLPSQNVLSTVLNKTRLLCGVNEHIFDHLRERVKALNRLDKYCLVMWDVISLEPGLQYNKKYDYTEGFVDAGGANRKPVFANHALVFMIKGIQRKWKQPLSFTFCYGTTSTADLVRIIKEMVRQVRKTGLLLVASVCDQGATNRAAINILCRETQSFCLKNNRENRYHGYLIDDIEIVHFFDTPHLMKGIRNSLLTKELHFMENGVHKVATWSHIMEFYNIDKKQGPYRQVYKLTDEHVLPSKINKMRVKNCTQVFSHTVAAAMYYRAKVSKELSPLSQFYLNPAASQTADALLFFDHLFDSVNGSFLAPSTGKELRSVVSGKSCHISTWREAIQVLESMYFLTSDKKTVLTPSLKNWIFTLKSFIYLTNILLNLNFNSVSPRVFQQDPLENIFSQIRHQSVHPTCTSFRNSFTTLLLNNLVLPRSPNAICEDDGSLGTLSNLKGFIKEVHVRLPDISQLTLPSTFTPTETVCDMATPYVTGAIAKRFFKKNRCETCEKILLSKSELPGSKHITLKKYHKNSFKYPSKVFTDFVRSLTNKILLVLPQNIYKYYCKNTIFENVRSDVTNILCDQHKNQLNVLIRIVINVVFFHYLKQINNVLKGSDLASKDNDYLMQLAHQNYQKAQRMKTFSQ